MTNISDIMSKDCITESYLMVKQPRDESDDDNEFGESDTSKGLQSLMASKTFSHPCRIEP